MIRLILTGLTIFVFLIATLPVLLIIWIIGLFDKEKRTRYSHAIIRWAFNLVLLTSGVKMDVYGAENIPTDRSVLYVGNHRSLYDIPLLYVNTPTSTGIISKKEIAKIPIFNVWMIFIGCLFLDRDDIKQGLKTILKAVDMVKDEGISMLIFPEGTRAAEEGTFLPFKGGSFKIAEKSGCDVVPFTIINSASIFEEHKPFVKKTHVIIAFGEPIRTADLDRSEFKKVPELSRECVMKMYGEYVGNL